LLSPLVETAAIVLSRKHGDSSGDRAIDDLPRALKKAKNLTERVWFDSAPPLVQALMVHRETHAARAPATQVMSEATLNPRKHYDTPEQLLADPELSDSVKQVQLTEWDSEMDNRLHAEAEGMSASDPISATRSAAGR